MNIEFSPQVQWGLEVLKNCLSKVGRARLFKNIFFENKEITIPNRFNKQGYGIAFKDGSLTISSSTPVGALYALLEIAERIRHGKDISDYWQDAPCMQYRGYTLGLQKQTTHFPDHKYYDWPITSENFPWFYDKNHMIQVIDRLACQRCNMLTLWSGHPFASLFKLDHYPEMLEVSEEQLLENIRHFDWLCQEAEKRGIQLFLHFYNIHMSDPLAKARKWDLMSGMAHKEICEYTRSILKCFVQRFSKMGLVVCMGEVLKKDEKRKWLNDVILNGIIQGMEDKSKEYPAIVLRSHGFDIDGHIKEAKKIYPNLITMKKHNSENLISIMPDLENIKLAKQSKNHIINVHLCANLEPFSWGSPLFIRETVEQMIKQEATGVHVYPLRFWDWPNSSHLTSSGNQLYEHYIWWTAWGRYAWNPLRDEEEESRFWQQELCQHYGINDDDAKLLLKILQETATVLPEISSQFMISSGNRQNISLGQLLVPLAFTRLQYHGGTGYSMSQLCGFPVIGERMWSLSPIERMKIQAQKCRTALMLMESMQKSTSESEFIKLIQNEIQVLLLLTEFYRIKAKACAEYFQVLYGVREASEEKARKFLEESVTIYREISSKTRLLFRDAGGLFLFRDIPLSAEKGYRHWKDCLPVLETELLIAYSGGIRELLSWKPDAIECSNIDE